MYRENETREVKTTKQPGYEELPETAYIHPKQKKNHRNSQDHIEMTKIDNFAESS